MVILLRGHYHLPMEVETHQTESDSVKNEAQLTKSTPDDTKAEDKNTHELSNYMFASDRQRRNMHPPARFGHADFVSYALIIAEELEHHEPKIFQEAISAKDKEKRVMAMTEELHSLERNHTWILVDRP